MIPKKRMHSIACNHEERSARREHDTPSDAGLSAYQTPTKLTHEFPPKKTRKAARSQRPALREEKCRTLGSPSMPLLQHTQLPNGFSCTCFLHLFAYGTLKGKPTQLSTMPTRPPPCSSSPPLPPTQLTSCQKTNSQKKRNQEETRYSM